MNDPNNLTSRHLNCSIKAKIIFFIVTSWTEILARKGFRELKASNGINVANNVYLLKSSEHVICHNIIQSMVQKLELSSKDTFRKQGFGLQPHSEQLP